MKTGESAALLLLNVAFFVGVVVCFRFSIAGRCRHEQQPLEHARAAPVCFNSGSIPCSLLLLPRRRLSVSIAPSLFNAELHSLIMWANISNPTQNVSFIQEHF